MYVIDDGSSDGTGEIARSFGVNVARNEKNIGKAHSLARLASRFELIRRYDYICLMDADTQVSEDYFQSVRKVLENLAWPWCAAGPRALRTTGLPHIAAWPTGFRTPSTKMARATWA